MKDAIKNPNEKNVPNFVTNSVSINNSFMTNKTIGSNNNGFTINNPFELPKIVEEPKSFIFHSGFSNFVPNNPNNLNSFLGPKLQKYVP
jgi:hypothetical protein